MMASAQEQIAISPLIQAEKKTKEIINAIVSFC